MLNIGDCKWVNHNDEFVINKDRVYGKRGKCSSGIRGGMSICAL